MSFKSTLYKIWDFIWYEDSLASWFVNIILAFLIVRFIIYPLLGLLLGTSYPLVAVVSSSMEHDTDFEAWWSENKAWYLKNDISENLFKIFPYKNGFNKGDIMVLSSPKNIKIGDILVYKTSYYSPIIHRVIKINQNAYITKGDNNPDKDPSAATNLVGKAIFRIPWLGYVKILAVEYIYNPIINLLR